MKKPQTFISGIIVTITALWPILSASYVALVLFLGWISIIIFPLLYAVITIGLICVFKKADLTFEGFIEKKITNEKFKNFFLVFFKKSKYIVLIFASALLCPLIIPILTKLCVQSIKRVYIIAVLLNFFSSILWICFYLGGLEIFKELIGIK